jgi:hypothetical protein
LCAVWAGAGRASLAGTFAAPLDEELADGTGAYRAAHDRWHALGQARDWDSLRSQVRRWQAAGNPGWSESEIDEVARSLNRAVFRFAEPAR